MSTVVPAFHETALLEFLQRPSFDVKALDAFTALLDKMRAEAPENVRLDIAERLSVDPPTTDVVRLCSALFYLTGDLYHLERLLHFYILLGDQVDIDKMHYAYWCIQRQMFLGRAAAPKAGAFGICDLHRFYQYILRTIETRWDLRPPPILRRSPGEPVRRIAMVTNQFIGGRHQPSRDCFDFARLLEQNHNVDVIVFNVNLLPLEPASTFVPPFIATLIDDYDGFQIIKMFENQVRVVSYKDRAFSRGKIDAAVRSIASFNPDVVIGFGGSNIVADLFARSRACPVATIPTTTGPLHSMADIILGFDRRDWTADLPTVYRRPFAGRFRPFTFGYSLPPLKPETMNVSLPENAPVLAVVGNRLDDEVGADFIELLEKILDRRNDAVVVFAGTTKTLQKRLSASRRASQFVAPGYVEDIRSLYRRCAVFLNPRRQGGGGGVAYALAEGLPVVTLPHGDGASVAGAEFHVADNAAFIDRTLALLEDSALHAAASNAASARFAAVGDRNRATAELLSYCNALVGAPPAG